MRLIDADKLYRKFGVYTEKASMECAKARNENERNVWDCIKEERSNVARMIWNEPTVNQWIPVSERLPEMYERVLISVKEDGHNERIELAFLAQPAPRNIRFRAIPHWYEIDDVLAWMPLPKPYEVEEE